MRISDWSSDVCSSDLVLLDPVSDAAEPVHQLQPDREPFGARRRGDGGAHAGLPALAASSIASRASNMPGVSLSHAWRWPIVSPPSTSRWVPVIKLDSSLAR